MGKAIKRYPLITYALVITLIFIGVPISSSAQETLTLVTYYPAPFGVYQSIRITQQLIIDENGGLSMRPSATTGASTDVPIFEVNAQGIEFLSPVFLRLSPTTVVNLAQALQDGEDYDALQTTQIMRNQIGVESIYDIAETIAFAMIFLGGTIYAAMVFGMIVVADIAMGYPTPVPEPTWWP